MEIKLQDQTVLVTGAAQGIGRVLAETFAAEGAFTYGLDIQAPAAETSPIAWLQCDVSDDREVSHAIEHVLATRGRIDVLINNAGINAEGYVDAIDPLVWDRAFQVNVHGTFTMCRAVIPAMKAQGSGRIINAASFAAIIPSVGQAAYAASKAAVVQLTRTLASELGPWNITVNAYAPGMIPTAMNGFADLNDEQRTERLNTLSLRRWGTAQEIANLVCFLASDRASYITGSLIDVSGGKLSTQAPWQAHVHSGIDMNYR